MTDTEVAETTILTTTGRRHIADAIAWLAEDHPMPLGTNWPQLLRALVVVADTSEVTSKAVRRVVREAVRSDVDTSKVIFDYDDVPKPEEFRSALNELISRSITNRLDGLTARDILRAQLANDLAVQTLCLVVGVTYSDAKDWFQVRGHAWKQHQIEQLLAYVRQLMSEPPIAPFPKSTTARAVELLASTEPGWSVVETYITEGVPYEVLLTQRAVGGAWLAHKNETSRFPNIVAADVLCEKLDRRGMDYRRAKTVGGSARQLDLQHLTGIPKAQVGLVIMSGSTAAFAVGFSSARDGGTARANGDGLMQIPVTDVPFALLLTGLGWAGRPETDRLAMRFSGRLFTERTLDDLVKCIVETGL
jgi:nucleotide-binding universal stress UspA family protein